MPQESILSRQPVFPSHPVIFGCALVVAVLVAWPLFRYFFGDLHRFTEDAELDTPENRAITTYFLGLGGWFRSDDLNLRIIGFVLVLAAVVGGSYQTLIWVTSFVANP